WDRFANNPTESDFGDWRVTDFATSQAPTTTNAANNNSSSPRTAQGTNDLGGFVTNVTLNPFMRSRPVAFVATGLRPNTRVYPYFANEAVFEFCAPGEINTALFDEETGTADLTVGREDLIVSRDGDY